MNVIPAFFKIGNDDIAVFVIKAQYAGSWLEVQVQQVEEVDALLLYIVIFPQFVVNSLKAGGVTRHHVVVVDVAVLCDDAEEGAQLRSPIGQISCRVFALGRGDVVGVGVIGLPCAVGTAPHEGGEAVILGEVNFNFLYPYVEEEVCNAFLRELGRRINLDRSHVGRLLDRWY